MAAAFLVVAVGRRPRDHAVLSLGALTVVIAGATASLIVLHSAKACSSDLWALNLPFAVASLTAFLPVGWYAAIASERQGEALMEPAFIFLLVALLFVANRYDAYVASGTVETMYVQPFAFAGFVTTLGISFVRRAITTERAVREIGLVSSITRLVASAVDLPGAIRPVLELVGPLVGADAVMLVLPEAGSSRKRYSWQAPSLDAPLLQDAIEHATALAEHPVGSARPSFRVDSVEGGTLVAAPVIGGGRHWGTFLLVSSTRRPTLRSQRRLIELIAAELAGLTRRMRHLTRLRDTAAADERHRIARELHDSVSQTLYSIAMVADTFPTVHENDRTTLETRARQIRSMTLQALDDVRVLLLEMRDSALESASLGGLLEQLSAEGEQPEVVVELDVTSEPNLPAGVKLAAFRIAREAVTNASRHAAATTVDVLLEQRLGAVTLRITDDGRGFDPGAVAPGRHGLPIMRERAVQVAAELVIDSAPGRGTRIQFSWAAPVAASPRVEAT